MRVYYYFDPKGKSEDATNGNFDVLDDILKNQRIKISRISRLNDPFDFQVSFANTTPQGYVRGFRNRFKQIDKKVGIICFSERFNNVLMWSHYAAKHSGLVIGLDIEDKMLAQVDYLPIAPRIIPAGGKCNGCPHRFGELMNTVMRTKAIDWAYEKEWRLILEYSNQQHIHEGKDGSRYYLLPPNSIRSIFIGLRCEMRVAELFSRLHIYELNQVSVYKMEQTFDGYSLSESCAGTYENRQTQIKLYLNRISRQSRN